MTELEIQRCGSCGAGLFPERLRCPACGSLRFERVPAGLGRVEEQTTLRRPPRRQDGADGGGPIRLGSVRLQAGPIVIARLDEEVGAGAGARLELAPDGAIWARKAH